MISKYSSSCLVVVLVAICHLKVVQTTRYVANVDTLKLVQVIFRHGDRAPTNTYPNDPVNQNRSAWPEGMAQLTSIGKMQQYNLGQYLRSRYDGFLADKYKSEELYVMSSDMDRTIMSVESNLAGLFPPIHKWHPNLDWQPIPLRTIPWKEDRYLHVNTHCPKYDKLHRDFLHHSEEVKRINSANKEFVEFLSTQSGLRATTVKEIISLQDIIFTELVHSLQVPQWASEALPKLNSLQAEINTWSTYTEEMKRLRGGPLLELLINNMLAKTGLLRSSREERRRIVVGGGNRKMLMFSAHDSTLSRIMNTIGIFDKHNPPYASALMFELHQDSQSLDHFVKIFYRNETSRAPYELTIPGCGSQCQLSKMIDLTAHLIPKNFEKECFLDDGLLFLSSPQESGGAPCVTYTYPDPLVVAVIASVIFVGSLLLWFCLSKFIQCTGCRCSNESEGQQCAKLIYPGRQFYYERL